MYFFGVTKKILFQEKELTTENLLELLARTEQTSSWLQKIATELVERIKKGQIPHLCDFISVLEALEAVEHRIRCSIKSVCADLSLRFIALQYIRQESTSIILDLSHLELSPLIFATLPRTTQLGHFYDNERHTLSVDRPHYLAGLTLREFYSLLSSDEVKKLTEGTCQVEGEEMVTLDILDAKAAIYIIRVYQIRGIPLSNIFQKFHGKKFQKVNTKVFDGLYYARYLRDQEYDLNGLAEAIIFNGRKHDKRLL